MSKFSLERQIKYVICRKILDNMACVSDTKDAVREVISKSELIKLVRKGLRVAGGLS